MSLLLNAIRTLALFARSHRWKLMAFVPLTSLWILLFFPYTDFRSLAVTRAEPLKASGITVDFASLSLSAPFGLHFTDFQIVKSGLEQILIDSVEISPSLSSLFYPLTGQGAEATVQLDGLFGGSVQASVSQKKLTQPTGETPGSESGRLFSLRVLGSEIDANVLSRWLSRSGLMNLKGMKGQVSLRFNAELSPGSRTLPNGEFDIEATQVQLPSISIPVQGSEVRLPKLMFSQMSIESSTENGVLNLDSIRLGQIQQDALSGSLSGIIPLSFLRLALPQTDPGAGQKLQLKLDITFKRRLYEEMMRYGGGGLLFIALDVCKAPAAKGAASEDLRFNCKIEVDSPYSQPRFSKI